MNSTTHIAILETGRVFTNEYQSLRSFIYHIWICIAIFGLAANTINIIVFAKIGLKDNVTITLLFLSASDLLNLIINTPIIVGRYMQKNEPQHLWPFDFFILILGPFWYAYVFYDYSSFISVFLATVRCACVARPLRFKSMFTKSRTIAILCVLFLVALTLRIPVLTVFRLSWAVSPQTNSTYRSIAFAKNVRDIYQANDILNRNIISWLAYVTVTSCVVVLASKLQSASKFRRSLAAQTTSNRQPEKGTTDGPTEKNLKCPDSSFDPHNSTSTSHSKKDSDKMSTKDLQVIQSVTLICVIFILSQLPFQVISTVRLFVPEFDNFGSAENIYGFASHISNTCGYLNASVNILVHIRFNTRYRAKFLAFFCKSSV